MSSEELKRYDSYGNLVLPGDPEQLPMFVLDSDYAALEAENARLRRAAQTNWNEFAEREAPRAQLTAIQGGMGEVVGFDRNAAYAACPESGCDWGSFYVGWKAAAAQHQRITAAMAAEVETWRSNALMLEQANVGLAQLNGKLRAELAEVKGREAVGEVQLRTGGGISLLHVDLTQPLPPGTKLYTTLPASPVLGNYLPSRLI